MAAPTAPLAQTLLALASSPKTPPTLLLRILRTLPDAVTEPSDLGAIRAALISNPGIPIDDAKAVAHASLPDGRPAAALLGRADASDADLEEAARTLELATTTGAIHPLLVAARDPKTPLRALRALLTVIGTDYGFHHSELVTHPNADADLVVLVLRRQLDKHPGETTHGRARVSRSLWVAMLRQLPLAHAEAAFDQVDDPMLLVDLAEIRPDVITAARVERLAAHVIAGRVVPQAMVTKRLGKTHLLTRAAAVLAAHGSLELRERCAEIFILAGLTLAGLDPREALALPTVGRRATAAIGRRKFTAVARDLSSQPAAADALGFELDALDDSQWGIFCRVVNDFPGTVDEVIDICRGISAAVG